MPSATHARVDSYFLYLSIEFIFFFNERNLGFVYLTVPLEQWETQFTQSEISSAEGEKY